jgi:hypothetical protein
MVYRGHGGIPTPKNLELAYDAAKSALSQQDATLTGLRNRAMWMFAVAAIAAAFTAGTGLLDDDRRWAGIALLAVLTLIAAAVLLIHWPAKQWTTGPNPTQICRLHDDGKSESEVRRHLLNEMLAGIKANQPELRFRLQALRGVIVLLWVELVVILLTVVW